MWMATCIGVVIAASLGQARPQRMADILKLPGFDAVPALQLAEYTVTSINKGAQTMELTGPNNRKITVQFDGIDQRINLLYFEEADVSERPLAFRPSGVFRVGQKLQASKVAIMRPMVLDKTDEKKTRGPSIGKEPEQETVDAKVGDKVPVLAQVEDVFALDTKEKRTAFEKLPPSVQRQMLIVAGNVNGMKDVPPVETVKLSPEQKALMNIVRVNSWIDRRDRERAFDAGIEELFRNSQIKADDQREMIRRFNELTRDQRRAVIALSRKVKAKGFNSLTDPQKKFAENNRYFFGKAVESADSQD